MLGRLVTCVVGQLSMITNTTSIPDEAIRNRLCFFPLKKVDIDHSYEELINGFHPRDKIELRIIAKYASKSVYARHLHCPQGYVFANPDTLLLELMKDQELEFNATIIEGVGEDHCSHKAVSKVWYTRDENGSYELFAELVGNLTPEEVINQTITIFANELADFQKTMMKTGRE